MIQFEIFKPSYSLLIMIPGYDTVLNLVKACQSWYHDMVPGYDTKHS